MKRMGAPPERGQPVNAFPCTLGSVASLDATLAKAETSGGRIALPKMAIPGVGWLAYLEDPEGNIFGVMQDEKTAR
jgi:predicted enzyme related to lactoylglutathione lyase